MERKKGAVELPSPEECNKILVFSVGKLIFLGNVRLGVRLEDLIPKLSEEVFQWSNRCDACCVLVVDTAVVWIVGWSLTMMISRYLRCC